GEPLVEAFVGAAAVAAAPAVARGAGRAERRTDLHLDLGGQVLALVQELLRVLATLTEPDIAVGEPRARLVHDVVLDAQVDQQARPADALVVHHVELRLLERRRHLVLHHLHARAVARVVLTFLDRADTADV